MTNEPMKESSASSDAGAAPAMPPVVDAATWHAEIEAVRVREKAHTRAGDVLAADRRRLPMVEIDPTIPLIGGDGPVTLLAAFEGRQQLIAYYFMWHAGMSAADQCEGCTWVTTQIGDLSFVHSRDVTYATFCQGSYEQSVRYRDFMGWDSAMPWYSAQDSLDLLLSDRQIGYMHIVCYLRDRDRVFETYWTNGRGVEEMDYNFALLDLTAYGRQETWEDSPPDWPKQWGGPNHPFRANGRPIPQWSRIEAGRSDDLTGEGSNHPQGR